ncbi:MAG: carboxypeptidase-like regulatory domain-containing protein, partial [Bacteroidales bacterium]|nr:carboxypeptidase-like regulatory domain-containing protein [Bacteroidales bacterium]
MKKHKPDYSKILLLCLICLGIFSTMNAQNISVSGVVTDESGEPVPGVYVLIKGSQSGTVTGTDGRFSLAGVPAAATLSFSFIGYTTQEVPVEGRTQ